MANHETDDEFELPDEIIQHIQSFMDESEAARTTLLSKSWCGAWSTRPNLSFDRYEFPRRADEFSEYAKKTMQRYEDRNLKIQALRLRMEGNHFLARELILKAIKLGATDFTIQIPTSGTTSFVLPSEVLESETLARLHICGLTVDLQRRKKVVTYSKLKSLSLTRVKVNGDLFRDLISRCPLIEKIRSYQLKSLFGDERSPFYEFAKLEKLRLNHLDIKDSLSRHDLCPKFPRLKELVIKDYDSDYEWNDVRICSTSLERISIRFCRDDEILNAEFDVPNIRKFKFVGYQWPRLQMKTSSREWESDIRIECLELESESSASWFSSLKQLVKMLSLSSRVSVSLLLDIKNPNYFPLYVGDHGLAIPTVENLTLRGCAVTSFLDALFWSCRPNFVYIDKRCVFSMGEVNVGVFEPWLPLPWKTLLDIPTYKQGSVPFQLQ